MAFAFGRVKSIETPVMFGRICCNISNCIKKIPDKLDVVTKIYLYLPLHLISLKCSTNAVP